MHSSSYLACEQRRHGVSYLNVLLGPITFEQVIVRKRLQAGGLSDGQAPTLMYVGMNEVVTVFRDMTCDCA